MSLSSPPCVPTSTLEETMAPSPGGGGHQESRDPEVREFRLKINQRERLRMHDLNSALDGLREVMPYANGPSVRKLSKIATMLLAKNYILMLQSSLEEMKKLVSDVYGRRSPPQHDKHRQFPVRDVYAHLRPRDAVTNRPRAPSLSPPGSPHSPPDGPHPLHAARARSNDLLTPRAPSQDLLTPRAPSQDLLTPRSLSHDLLTPSLPPQGAPRSPPLGGSTLHYPPPGGIHPAVSGAPFSPPHVLPAPPGLPSARGAAVVGGSFTMVTGGFSSVLRPPSSVVSVSSMVHPHTPLTCTLPPRGVLTASSHPLTLGVSVGATPYTGEGVLVRPCAQHGAQHGAHHGAVRAPHLPHAPRAHCPCSHCRFSVEALSQPAAR